MLEVLGPRSRLVASTTPMLTGMSRWNTRRNSGYPTSRAPASLVTCNSHCVIGKCVTVSQTVPASLSCSSTMPVGATCKDGRWCSMHSQAACMAMGTQTRRLGSHGDTCISHMHMHVSCDVCPPQLALPLSRSLSVADTLITVRATTGRCCGSAGSRDHESLPQGGLSACRSTGA